VRISPWVPTVWLDHLLRMINEGKMDEVKAWVVEQLVRNKGDESWVRK